MIDLTKDAGVHIQDIGLGCPHCQEIAGRIAWREAWKVIGAWIGHPVEFDDKEAEANAS